jgi:hypothetical protein
MIWARMLAYITGTVDAWGSGHDENFDHTGFQIAHPTKGIVGTNHSVSLGV